MDQLMGGREGQRERQAKKGKGEEEGEEGKAEKVERIEEDEDGGVDRWRGVEGWSGMWGGVVGGVVLTPRAPVGTSNTVRPNFEYRSAGPAGFEHRTGGVRCALAGKRRRPLLNWART